MIDYSTLRPNPPNWTRTRPPALLKLLPNAAVLGAFMRNEGGHGPLRALVTVDLYPDDVGHWLHVSVSRANRLPSWRDLCVARDELGFGDRMFVQLLPPRSHWLNVHDYVLHLQSRLDGDTVPPTIWRDQEGADGQTYMRPAPLRG